MKHIKLSLGQYISDIEPFKSFGIPNNSIGHKTLAGCGITTWAIERMKQNLILMLPNVPVIKAKVAKHNKKFPNQPIIGVYKDTDVDDIEVYLLKDSPYKKILTTPEGFINKVVKAFGEDRTNLYRNYFLLFDECERVITDVSYRGAIAAPFDEFSNFENKALVSATTLPYSSELFKDFDHYVIEPEYNYSKSLKLVTTNNVLGSLKSYLDELNSEQVYIFFNSTEGIKSVIDGLGIKDSSAVFCAQKSVSKLLTMKFKDATAEFSIKDLKKYNFFTSRYFSAIDIELDIKADVIIISDLFAAEHSIIDPQTEAIQIAGRFRNGLNSLAHIANFKSTIEVMEQADAINYLNGCFDLHEDIIELLERSTQKASIDMLCFFKKFSPMANYYSNGKRNPFMIDNALNEHRVKGYYQQSENLVQAYANLSKHFSLIHQEEVYPASDENLYLLKSDLSKKEQMREAAKLLMSLAYKLNPGSVTIRHPYMDELRNSLIELYPFLPEAIGHLGLDGLEETNYVKSAITKAVVKKKRLIADIEFAPYVHTRFAGLSSVNEPEMIEDLKSLATEHDYPYKITGSLIKRFFDDASRSSKAGINTWKLGLAIDLEITQE